jgi:myo-inositol-1(or 4)-monophosphatase
MKPDLTDLESLARQAGDILRSGFIRRPGYAHSHSVVYKSAIDPVTEFDHRSEEFLLGEIRRRFPDSGFVTEESGVLGAQDGPQWFIDPLDGTVNFAHGVPIFTVSLAYAEAGVLELGVVYDPMQNECFSAGRGQGAWLNGEPIRPSSVQDLDHSLLVTGFPYNIRTIRRNNLDLYARFSLLSQGVRRLGSAAMDLCYVAAGRVDGFWELSLGAWDMAAGTLIAREAGGTVTSTDGSPELLKSPYSVLAAAPGIHAAMLAVIQE